MVNIAKDKEKTFIFLASCVVLLCQNLEAGRIRRAVEVQVDSPTEFKLTLPKGKLLHMEVKVNRNSGFGKGRVDFERNETTDEVLHFSNENLNLKRGDEIYYNGVFVRYETPFGEGGIYNFDGNFHSTNRKKRQVPTEEPEPSKHVIQPRFGHFKKHWWGPPSYPHRRHFGHGYMHGHPGGPGLFNHRPALWGFGHVGKYGDHGPWDGQHGGEEDFYDWQLNNNNKNREDDNKFIYDEVSKPDENSKPWNGQNGQDDLENKVPDEKVPDVVKPVYETPDAMDIAPPIWNGTATITNGNNSDSSSDSSTTTTETETQPVPITTTEQVPDIDIRFREIDEDE